MTFFCSESQEKTPAPKLRGVVVTLKDLRRSAERSREVAAKRARRQQPSTSRALNDNGEPESLIDPQWEFIDPTPDIHALFVQFNERFFWNLLGMVEVRWSPRMTT